MAPDPFNQAQSTDYITRNPPIKNPMYVGAIPARPQQPMVYYDGQALPIPSYSPYGLTQSSLCTDFSANSPRFYPDIRFQYSGHMLRPALNGAVRMNGRPTQHRLESHCRFKAPVKACSSVKPTVEKEDSSDGEYASDDEVSIPKTKSSPPQGIKRKIAPECPTPVIPESTGISNTEECNCENSNESDETWTPAVLPPMEKSARMCYDPKMARGPCGGEYGNNYQGRSNKCNCCGHFRHNGYNNKGPYAVRRNRRDEKEKTENADGTEPKKLDSNQIKQLVTDHKCIICAVEFTSTVQRKQHIEGRKHKKRLKFLIDNGSEDLLPSLEKAAQEAAEAAASNADSDANSEDNIDEDGDIEMDDIDDHSAFEEGLAFLRSVCKSQRDQNKLTQIAFELFRMMEDYLRFLTKCYVSPGLDPRRMSWNELLNVLKRNTVNRLSSSFDRKLDNVRQLRNSVVHSFSMSLSEDGLGKIFSIADDLVIWGRGFKMNATTVYPKATDGTAPNIYEGLYRRHFQ